MNQREMSEKYKVQSIHYLENAFVSMEAGHPEKAGEFLWGSMAQAIKAVAASKEMLLESHGELRNFARELAKEQKDDSIFKVFRDAESLHKNFYEFGFELEDVRISAQDVREGVAKLLKLIPA